MVFLEYGERRYRDAIIQRLAEMGYPGKQLVMPLDWVSSGPVLEALAALPPDHAPVHILELGTWLRLEQGMRFCWLLNGMRDIMAEKAARPILIWLSPSELRTLALEAPDLWSWRSAVLTFTRPSRPQQEAILPPLLDVERINLRHNDTVQRISTIDNHLATYPEPSWAVASLWKERGQLHRQLGEWDKALADLRKARTLFEDQNDPRTASEVGILMVESLLLRGESEIALNLLKNEVFTVFEKLGDLRFCAITMSRIADVLQGQGQLDEALRIYEEQIPIFEKIGDTRERAIAMGGIAHVLQARGQLDEALRVYRELIPIFEKIGDIRLRAVTITRIVDVLKSRGEFDEALRAYKEQLPVFEKIGDLHSRTTIMSKIADVHKARGELDLALRIHEEQLPVFEKLGDLPAITVTKDKIAAIRQAQETPFWGKDSDAPFWGKDSDAPFWGGR
ncbi:MAG: tetratricopeptide repeat protein [Magnetococcales bacterium]|nr:tetratricopeptide repeat protein [Magnetococcales bacterium]